MAWYNTAQSGARVNTAASPTSISNLRWTYSLTAPMFWRYGAACIAGTGHVWGLAVDVPEGGDYLAVAVDKDGNLAVSIPFTDSSSSRTSTDSIATDADGNCYLPLSGDSLVSYDLAGALRWRYAPTGGLSSSSPCCMADDGFLYCLRNDIDTGYDWVVALNPADGSVHHEFNVDPLGDTHGAIITWQFSIANGRVYIWLNSFPDRNNLLTAFDALTGAKVWQTDVTAAAGLESSHDPTSISVYGGHVYAYVVASPLSAWYGVVSLTEADGTYNWIYTAPGVTHGDKAWEAPVIAPYSGGYYVIVNIGGQRVSLGGATDDIMRALSPSDGSVVWAYSDALAKLNTPQNPATTGSDGFLLVQTRKMARIRVLDGVLDSEALPADSLPTPASLDSARGRVYVCDVTRTLYAFGSDDIWPQFGKTPTRTNQRDGSTDCSNEIWTYENGTPQSPPLVTTSGKILFNNGEIDVVNPDGTLHANIADGSDLIASDAAERVYILYDASGGFNGSVLCYDIDGTLLWTYDSTPDRVQGNGFLIGDDGFAYFVRRADSDGHDWIVALKPTDGTVDHAFDSDPTSSLVGGLVGSFANNFAYSGGFLYFATRGATILKYNATTGALIYESAYTSWTGAFTSPEHRGPTILDGKVYCLAVIDIGGFHTDYALVSLNASDGSFNWYATTRRLFPNNFGDGVCVGNGVAVMQIVDDRGTFDCALCVNLSDGSIKWKYTHPNSDEQLGNQDTAAPVMGNDGFVLLPRDHTLRLSLADGTLHDTITTENSPFSPALGSA